MQINTKERSLISQRPFYDLIHANKIIIEDYEIPDELMMFVKSSNKKYKAYLEAEKKKRNAESVDTKRKLIKEEVVNVKR